MDMSLPVAANADGQYRAALATTDRQGEWETPSHMCSPLRISRG